MSNILKLKHQVDLSLPKVNAMYSNKDLKSNKKQDSSASSGFTRPTAPAKESF
jgi:hypothetical protein